MGALNPAFLWALPIVVAAVLLLHLYGRTKPRSVLAFTNLRLIADILKDRQRGRRLQDIVLIGLRCLAVACVFAALARPYWHRVSGGGGGDPASASTLWVAVDLSY